MAAHHHRRQAVIGAGAAGEDVADAVDADGEAGLAAPADEGVADLLVGIGQRETGEPARPARADLGRALDRGPEPLDVDTGRVEAGHDGLLSAGPGGSCCGAMKRRVRAAIAGEPSSSGFQGRGGAGK